MDSGVPVNDGESASIAVGADIESNDRHAGIVWPGEVESERETRAGRVQMFMVAWSRFGKICWPEAGGRRRYISRCQVQTQIGV